MAGSTNLSPGNRDLTVIGRKHHGSNLHGGCGLYAGLVHDVVDLGVAYGSEYQSEL